MAQCLVRLHFPNSSVPSNGKRLRFPFQRAHPGIFIAVGRLDGLRLISPGLSTSRPMVSSGIRPFRAAKLIIVTLVSRLSETNCTRLVAKDENRMDWQLQ